MAKKGYTDITLVLDRSGSMGVIQKDTIGGVNTFLETQKSVPGEATFTLIQFDGNEPRQVTYDSIDIKKVPALTTESYTPRGSTPLLDAIGINVVKVGERLAAMDEKDRPEHVVFVILTDGEENCIKEYTKDQVKELVEKQTKEFSWDFMFLGANMDAISVGSSFGISGKMSMSFSHNSGGILNTVNAMSTNLATYRATGSLNEYSDEQRLHSMVSQ